MLEPTCLCIACLCYHLMPYSDSVDGQQYDIAATVLLICRCMLDVCVMIQSQYNMVLNSSLLGLQCCACVHRTSWKSLYLSRSSVAVQVGC